MQIQTGLSLRCGSGSEPAFHSVVDPDPT
jgi:hypothetical protein